MPPISGKSKTMSNADITALTRNAAAMVVQRRERDSGSRMVAYEQVAAMVGVSSDWLRKFIAKSSDATPNLVAGLNILAAYDRMCARFDKEAEIERAKLAKLKDEIHAATTLTFEMACAEASAKMDGGSALVAETDAEQVK